MNAASGGGQPGAALSPSSGGSFRRPRPCRTALAQVRRSIQRDGPGVTGQRRGRDLRFLRDLVTGFAKQSWATRASSRRGLTGYSSREVYVGEQMAGGLQAVGYRADPASNSRMLSSPPKASDANSIDRPGGYRAAPWRGSARPGHAVLGTRRPEYRATQRVVGKVPRSRCSRTPPPPGGSVGHGGGPVPWCGSGRWHRPVSRCPEPVGCAMETGRAGYGGGRSREWVRTRSDKVGAPQPCASGPGCRGTGPVPPTQPRRGP